jgi:hypothetical protein
MSPQADVVQAPYVSVMTLTVLEELGVYYPNYKIALDPAYGLGQGYVQCARARV